jgi:hypothetical protein
MMYNNSFEKTLPILRMLGLNPFHFIQTCATGGWFGASQLQR